MQSAREKNCANIKCDKRMLSWEWIKSSEDYFYPRYFFFLSLWQKIYASAYKWLAVPFGEIVDSMRLLTLTSIYIWLVRDICFERVCVANTIFFLSSLYKIIVLLTMCILFAIFTAEKKQFFQRVQILLFANI